MTRGTRLETNPHSVADGFDWRVGKAQEIEDLQIRAILTTYKHDIDLGGVVLLNPENDCLARDRGTLSVGTSPSDGRGVGVGGVEEGRVVGRKREGRSAFIMVAC